MTEPAPITAPSPIVTPLSIITRVATHTLSSIMIGKSLTGESPTL